VSTDVSGETLTVVLAPRDLLAAQCTGGKSCFLVDVANPPLSDTRQTEVIAIDAKLSVGNSVLTITPHAALPAGTAFTLVLSGDLRDTAGNPLVDASGNKNPFLYEFSTDAGAPSVASTDLPTGTSLVVPNRKRIDVTFNQPVQNVDASTLTITGSPAASIAAILIDPTRTTASIVLADPASGCARLGVSSTYSLQASAGIVGDTGQALTPFSQPFTTGSACDTSANILSAIDHTDGDTFATIHFSTSKPSTSEVRFGLAGGALDCLGGACPVVGAPTVDAGAAHTVELTGLSVGVDYDFVASAEDEVGLVANGTGTIHTEAIPKVTVNEMLAHPSSSPQDLEEFVELANFDPSASIDVSAWSLRVSHDTVVSTCALPAATSIAPGGFLVVAGTAFAPTHFSVDSSSVVKIAPMCSLTDSAALLVELLDDTGRPIASMSAPVSSHAGSSIERTSPDAPDAEDNFCLQPVPTPGAQNGVLSSGCP
jgi:hypothetical protein